jgi:heme-degrading monooxygenase HmoA
VVAKRLFEPLPHEPAGLDQDEEPELLASRLRASGDAATPDATSSGVHTALGSQFSTPATQRRLVMHARISHVAGSPENADQGIESFRNTTLPEVKSQQGNRGAILLIDRATGKGMAITLWEDEAAMQSSEEWANTARRAASEQMGASGEAQVERYEVAVFET